MKPRFADKRRKQSETALERIHILFEKAKEALSDKALSKRYVELARKISTRTNTRMPKELKTDFCKKCNTRLVFGKNATARTSKGKMVYTCLECGAKRIVPFRGKAGKASRKPQA